jgi:hypothetical protein
MGVDSITSLVANAKVVFKFFVSVLSENTEINIQPIGIVNRCKGI